MNHTTRNFRYKKEDFVLSSGISLESVEVGNTPSRFSPFFPKVWMEREPNKKNLLLTHWENTTLPHRVGSQYQSNACPCDFQDDYVIEYKRINHYDFKFLLKMKNPNRVDKKVIVRLWLVPTNRTSSSAKYDPSNGFVKFGIL